jgi:signal transduction histidine kinase
MSARFLDGLTIKAVLLLGFGLTLGLWLIATYDFTRRMSQVEREAAAINARYMQAQELLSNVRPRVLLASVYVRDALLDPDPRNAADYRGRLERTLGSVDEALRQYVPVLQSTGERERVDGLRREIEQFGAAMLQVLATDGRRSGDEARALLARLAPRRETVIGVSEKVQALNRAAFIQQQASVAETYRANQEVVWRRFGLSVAASLGIALLAVFHVTRLERRLYAQSVRDAENARDMKRLSAQVLHAQEEERRTLARELHDEVGQVLMAVKVELALAQRRIESGATQHVLGDAQALADGALHTIRSVSRLLHPAVLDDLGLAAAIEWYAQEFARRHGIRVDVRHSLSNCRLPTEVETTVYRIVQEALTNVARHAGATSCRVAMSLCGEDLKVVVEDDGIGFDVAARKGAGLGLIGIRERVGELGGSVVIDSRPGASTSLRAVIPARRAAVVTSPDPDVLSGAAPEIAGG